VLKEALGLQLEFVHVHNELVSGWGEALAASVGSKGAAAQGGLEDTVGRHRNVTVW